jgi:hypothetical protein
MLATTTVSASTPIGQNLLGVGRVLKSDFDLPGLPTRPTFMGSSHGINLLQNHENNTKIMKIIDTLVHLRQFRVRNTCIPSIL